MYSIKKKRKKRVGILLLLSVVIDQIRFFFIVRIRRGVGGRRTDPRPSEAAHRIIYTWFGRRKNMFVLAMGYTYRTNLSYRPKIYLNFLRQFIVFNKQITVIITI